MLISTMNDVPAGSQFGAAFKSLAGGELKGMTKNLQLSREDVVNRMVAEARPVAGTPCWPCASTRRRWAGTGRRSAPTARPSS